MRKYVPIAILLLVCISFAYSQDTSLLERAYLVRHDKKTSDSLLNRFVQQWKSETQRLPVSTISRENEKLSRLVQQVYDEILSERGDSSKFILVQDSIPVITFNAYLYGIPSNRVHVRSNHSETLYLTREIDSLLHNFIENYTTLEAGAVKDEENSSIKFLREHGIHLTYDTDFHYRNYEWDYLVLQKKRSYRRGILITPTVPYVSHLVHYGNALNKVTAVVRNPWGEVAYNFELKGEKWKLVPPPKK